MEHLDLHLLLILMILSVGPSWRNLPRKGSVSACIARKVINGDIEDPSFENVWFLLSIDGRQADQIDGYNQVVDQLNAELDEEYDEDSEQIWRFRQITAHQGPLSPSHPEYKGSTYNILGEWENGETTYEPLNVFAKVWSSDLGRLCQG